ncbi:Gfo/Idh/MocA family oxidoreductase [Georgenia halophila]|uniref:Gfo/Idh/MocA family oxidoreductase n=1 Tax=Georgenia halophila TaxID=620889 RepID=A0ABP8LJ20_9MICO
MPARLGIGVLGLGSIGITHARALRELGDLAELRAFSGGSRQQAAEAGWPEAVQVAPEAVARRPDIDLVAVCSPSDQHADQALAALEAGRHVVVEKPMALEVGAAERVVEAARARGLSASVISQRRFEPEYATVERLVSDGDLGALRLATTHVHWWRDETYYASAPWRARMAAGGGSLMNQGAHNVDLLLWLCGPVAEVTAQYGTLAHRMDAEDTTVATLRFASGALGLLSTSTATPPGSSATVALHTARGAIELGQGQVLRWDVDGLPAPSEAGSGAASGAADPAAIGHRGHVAQWQNILESLHQGRTPKISAEDGAAVVRLMCAVYEAAESGRAVRPEELA